MRDYTIEGYREWFKEDKLNIGFEFPNLPYFIHGDLKLTESIAIHEYIAEAFDKSLLGKNAKDKANVNMLSGVLVNLRNKIVQVMYGTGEKKTIIEDYKKDMPTIIEFMGKNDFLVGDYPTFIDFYFFEVI